MKEKLSIFLRGLTRTLSGSLVSGLFIGAYMMFRLTSKAQGYEAAAIAFIGICFIVCGCISFYLLGGGLAAGALVLLVTKKRMDRTR